MEESRRVVTNMGNSDGTSYTLMRTTSWKKTNKAPWAICDIGFSVKKIKGILETTRK